MLSWGGPHACSGEAPSDSAGADYCKAKCDHDSSDKTPGNPALRTSGICLYESSCQVPNLLAKDAQTAGRSKLNLHHGTWNTPPQKLKLVWFNECQLLDNQIDRLAEGMGKVVTRIYSRQIKQNRPLKPYSHGGRRWGYIKFPSYERG